MKKAVAELELIICCCWIYILVSVDGRQFNIDYDRNCFAKDGDCFRYIAGCMHYFRVPHQFWEDRILKIRAAGLNAIETILPWSFHQIDHNQYRFDGDANIVKFAQLVNKYDMLLIIRPGPFTCGMTDMGGIPWWLLRDYPDIQLRTSDPRYLTAADQWFSILLPKLKPLLYANGGPIISIQVENEYGAYFACDHNYTQWIRDRMRHHLGSEVILFSTDMPYEQFVKCGHVDGVYSTVDFGPLPLANITHAFNVQRLYAPKGPLVNSEYYTGWDDYWTMPHQTKSIDMLLQPMIDMYHLNASFSFYMFHGGTNFGFTNGAVSSENLPTYEPGTTSYDYDAPLNEAGDPTPKYIAIRETLEKLSGKKNPFPVPKASVKTAYGKVKMTKIGDLFEILPLVTNLNKTIYSKYPENMEKVSHGYGFILYSTRIALKSKTLAKKVSKIEIPKFGDRVYAILNKKHLLGILQREKNSSITIINLSKFKMKTDDRLHLLVENQGRICAGAQNNDSKGLLSNVTLNGYVLTDWKIQPILLDMLLGQEMIERYVSRISNLKKITKNLNSFVKGNLPTLYFGTWNITEVTDTFFDSSGWQKGQLLINKQNLGRYWSSQLPQRTLYVPSIKLKKGQNHMLLFELESSQVDLQAEFIDHQIW